MTGEPLTQRNPSAARAAFDRAVAAMRAGDVTRAERLCRRGLERNPRDGNLHSLLGAALMKRGKPDAAESHLRRTIELLPGAAGGYEGLGEALLQQGKLEEALHVLEAARGLEPARVSVLTRMGDVLTQLGRHDAAMRVYRDLVSGHPNEVGALQRLGGAAFRSRLYPEAEAVFMRVVALTPGLYQGWMDLGLVQLQQDKLARAEQSFREAARADPQRAEPHAALGTVLTVAGRHDDAIAQYELALSLDGTNAEALAGLGHVLKTIGERTRSIAAYRRCIEQHPEDGEAYWALANMKTFQFDDREIAAMREQLAGNRLATGQRTSMLFALAYALECRAEFDAAFDLYRRGNESHRRRFSYDTRQTALACDELIRVFSAGFLRARAGHGDPDGSPIFIVGLPRSGSTLIEQILASHSEVEGTHELSELNQVARSTAHGRTDGTGYPATVPDLSDEQLRRLGGAYLERTRAFRTGAPRFTDKMPNNFRHVGLLALILPNASIINARRHPLDTCMSCYKQLFAHGQSFSYDLRELGEYYLLYERLMDHWHEVLPGRVLDVQYETLIQDLEAQSRRLLDHCGLAWEDGCLRFHDNRRAVRSASSEQVRQPIYASGMHRWRNYASHLGPLIDVLEPVLRRLPRNWQPQGLRAGVSS